tara:strand:+ start:448 stop:1032 length:585 start_codon:yes stop_codon:yes gene_type:complete
MIVDAPTFELNSDSFGIGYSSEGVGVTLNVKNKGIDSVTVLKGWLECDYGLGIIDWRTLPFYIPYNNQQYNQLQISYDTSGTIPNMPNFGGSGTTPTAYNNSHRFHKAFNLRHFDTYEDVMKFDLMFFPYYPGVYNGDLYIEYNENQGESNIILHIKVAAKAVGIISEIDHTLIPEMTISVDRTDQTNLEFYFD